jgi:hypothetical protein
MANFYIFPKKHQKVIFILPVLNYLIYDDYNWLRIRPSGHLKQNKPKNLRKIIPSKFDFQ